MGEKTTNKTHRLWMIIVSLIIATAAILAIVVIATIGSKTAKKDELKPIDEATAVTKPVETTPSDTSTDTPTSANTSDFSTITSDSVDVSNSSSNTSSASSKSSSVPNTGPSDVIGLALLLGSAAAYLASTRMAKAKGF
jgi:flagellar basal body-associated protein FliL